MAFVFSTDKSYTEFVHKRTRKPYERKQTLFVTFTGKNKNKYGATGAMNLSADLSRKVCMGKTAIVGIDKEANQLVIIPSLVGNIKVNKQTYGQYEAYGNMTLYKFFLSQGIEQKDFPRGRYEATVDEEGNIKVNLNSPIRKEEE